MCTETPFSCARQRSLMWLPVLQLRHGRRSGDAAPELSAEEGSDPPLRDACDRHRGARCGMCTPMPPLRRGSLPSSITASNRPRSTRTSGYNRNRKSYNSLSFMTVVRVPLQIYKYERDCSGPNGRAADLRTEFRGAKWRHPPSCGPARRQRLRLFERRRVLMEHKRHGTPVARLSRGGQPI